MSIVATSHLVGHDTHWHSSCKGSTMQCQLLLSLKHVNEATWLQAHLLGRSY